MHWWILVKQRGTFWLACWEPDFSQDLCWVSSSGGRPLLAGCQVLDDFPRSQHRPSLVHIGLTLSHTQHVQKTVELPEVKLGQILGFYWEKHSRYGISVDDPLHQCHVQSNSLRYPQGSLYILCVDAEAQALLDKYEKSGDPDIADHLIEPSDAARRARWEARMNFTHSSWKSWALRRLGDAQHPPQSARPPVSANKLASHLIQVAKAPANKAFERKVCDGWHQAHQNSAEDLRFQAILPGEGVSALGQMKFGTAPGYDFVHLVFLKHLGPSALTWLADLFTRMTWEQRIPKIWRQAKIVALAKPYKDAHLAASYRLVSLQPWKTFSVSIRLASAANFLPQGSLLAPSLFNLYTSDLPVTHSRRFIYANDICCALIQAETFSEIRVHKQLILRDTVSCGIWNPACPRLWQVFSICITTGHAVSWMFTWMVNVWNTTPTQCILVSL